MTSKFGGVELNASKFGGIPVVKEPLDGLTQPGSRFGGIPLSKSQFGGTVLPQESLPQEAEEQVSADVKERIDELPWYESMLYEVEKMKHNMAFGAMEGIGELYRSGMELIGKDVKNPMDEGMLAKGRMLAGLTKGVTPQEHEESTVRELSKVASQLTPVGIGVKAVTSIPKVAKVVQAIPKALRLPAGAGITEFIAFASDEKGIADAIAEAGLENPLQKKETDSVFVGNAKNFAEGVAGLGAGKTLVKVADKTLIPAINKTFTVIEKPLEKLDKYIKPVKTRMKELDPFVASRMDRFELDNLLLKQDFADRLKPFADQFKNLNKNEQLLFQRLTSNSETMPEAYKMLDRVQKRKGMDGIKENFRSVTSSLDDLYKMANKDGIEIEYREDYFPRFMKDHDGYMKSLGVEPKSRLQQMFREAEKKKFDDLPEQMKVRTNIGDTTLSEAEQAKVIQDYFEGKGIPGSGKMGLQKQRVVDSITEKNQKFYDDFLGGLQKYVDSVTYKVNKNRFLGKSPDPTARSVFEDVARMEDDKAKGEITDLLTTRFKGGEARVGKGTNIARNVIYATTIANPYSTITQLGDLALNSYRNGLINTVSPFGPKIKLKDFGLNDMASEFTDAGAMKGTMDKLFRVTGFKKLDMALKENNLRGSFRQAQAQLRNKGSKESQKFIEENKPFFGDETNDLVDAIRRGDSQNENVKHYLFSRLTKTQPISMSEMPEAYLNMKGGRLAYALKTFFVKQLDVLREDIIKQLSKRETTKQGVQNAARFAMMFGGGTAAVNITKDMMLGRPVEISDELMDVALQMVGVSRYSIYKGKSDGAVGFLASVLAPPMPIVNEAFKVVASDEKGEALEKQSKELVRYIPIVGKDLYWRVGAGKEKIEKQELDRLRGKD